MGKVIIYIENNDVIKIQGMDSEVEIIDYDTKGDMYKGKECTRHSFNFVKQEARIDADKISRSPIDQIAQNS